MFELIFAIFVVTIVIYGQGIAFNKYIVRKSILISDFFEIFFFGFIFLGFNILIINFFYPIDKIIGTIVLLLSVIIFIVEVVKNNQTRILLIKFTILTFISFFLIAFSNVNRPDAGLYHLPFISILNENKIIIGLSNLHFRFGHISIIQYVSSAFNNFLIPIQSISIPTALIFSTFIFFLYTSLKDSLKQNNIYFSLIYFMTLIVSVYSYNRFSEYGNDAPSHIFFLLLFIYILTKDKENQSFSNILLISTFLVLLKPFMAVLIFLIIYLFFKQKNKINLLFDKKIIFSVLLLIFWIIKNIMTSGCIIYPISKLCSDEFIITDLKKTKIEEISGEAWSKDWSNYKKGKYDIEEYNKNFRWLNTWYKNHFKIILEKFSPIVIFLIFIYIVLSLNSEKNKKKFSIENYFLIILFLFFVFSWFIKFPLYRYGSSFLIVFSIYLVIFLTTRFDYSNKIKNIKLMINCFLFVAIIFFFAKNTYRIINNFEHKLYFPQIYSLNDIKQNKPTKFLKVDVYNKGSYYFSDGNLCMYSSSPCTHIKLNDIVFKQSYKYKIFYKK
tara:strand:- start:1086 stop:2750 length:1665 start_codon:yes stop_codon:yes gene_type:complete